MKKFTKIILVIAASCIAIGLCLTFAGYAAGAGTGVSIQHGKVVVIDNKKNEKYTYEKTDISKVTEIDVSVYNAKINLVPSNTDQFTVNVDMTVLGDAPEVTTDNGKITVNEKQYNGVSSFNIFTFLSLFDMFDSENVVTIGVPNNAELDQVTLDTSNGAVETLADYTVKNLKIESSNGHITLDNITCTNTTYAKTSNGAIECTGIFGDQSEFKSSNGHITADGTFKGDVECRTSNGRIEFRTDEKETYYDVSADTSNGSIYINGVDHDDDYSQHNSAGRNLILKTSNGGIKANFK